MKACKEAGADVNHQKRPAPHPGPRCATCWRAVKKDRQRRAHGLRVEKVYGISDEEYWELYRLQDGHCGGCGKATGKTKRLAVDHDHKCEAGHAPEVGCPECVRGLLCGRCNRLVGYLFDSPEAFERYAAYLRNPPARGLRRFSTGRTE